MRAVRGVGEGRPCCAAAPVLVTPNGPLKLTVALDRLEIIRSASRAYDNSRWGRRGCAVSERRVGGASSPGTRRASILLFRGSTDHSPELFSHGADVELRDEWLFALATRQWHPESARLFQRPRRRLPGCLDCGGRLDLALDFGPRPSLRSRRPGRSRTRGRRHSSLSICGSSSEGANSRRRAWTSTRAIFTRIGRPS